MKRKETVPDVGVIVGRFQVNRLHEGHMDLIDHVCDQHRKVIIFLGLSPVKGTTENPLDFEARKQMIQEEYPHINVLYIDDMWSDEKWSRKLDQQISHLVTPSQTVILYGSRDSFIDHYHGKHETCELEAEAEEKTSGKEVRRQVKAGRAENSEDFRSGAIWQAHNRFPTCYVAVDIAIFNEAGDRIVLGKKPDEPSWRLPGGFIDPGTSSLESNARREAHEETNLSITDPEYVGSFAIDDWRYRGERDCIMSVLFKAKKQFGELRASDDLEYADWFDIDVLTAADIMPNHVPLLGAVIDLKGHK